MALRTTNFIVQFASTRLVGQFESRLWQNTARIQGRKAFSTLLHYDKVKTITPFHRGTSLRAAIVSHRFISSHQMTKNIVLATEDSSKVKFDSKSLKLKEQRDRPLVLILGWLLSNPKHLKKIAQLYTTQGYDALIVRTSPLQLMFPLHGGQYVAQDVLNFMTNNVGYKTMVLHGFSVAAYLWSEVMLKMEKDLGKYQPVADRFRAQVWDSVVDTDEMPIGISRTVFPDSRVLQWTLKTLLEQHMKIFHKIVVTRYDECHSIFYYRHLIRSPALMYVSKTDLVGTEKVSSSIRKCWEESKIPVTYKCWDNSPHVSHIVKHREEYLQLLSNHLQSTNMLPHPDKIWEVFTPSTSSKKN